ncbi:uncharacterized protein LOC133917830 [Phragmites australis]|uniref:uncharacterized protein LOC133917830 n=1 Tax=Phragmites australis TaxID=29695 RepID=UPI002D76FAA0|nr:uncharacterized protein LOC133917830 [Phragmites australis]
MKDGPSVATTATMTRESISLQRKSRDEINGMVLSRIISISYPVEARAIHARISGSMAVRGYSRREAGGGAGEIVGGALGGAVGHQGGIWSRPTASDADNSSGKSTPSRHVKEVISCFKF